MLFLAPTHLVAEQLQKLPEQLTTPHEQPKFREWFLVKMGQKMITIDSRDMAYITIKHGVSVLVTKQKQQFTLGYSPDQLEAMRGDTGLFRANRQLIVASNAILAVHPDLNSKPRIELKTPGVEEIIASRERASQLKSWMGE